MNSKLSSFSQNTIPHLVRSSGDFRFIDRSSRKFTLVCLTGFLLLAQGCGSQETDSQVQTPPILEEEALPIVPPTVSIEAPLLKLDKADEKKPAEPVKTVSVPQQIESNQKPEQQKPVTKGSVEWLLQDIVRLQAISKASAGQKHQSNPLLRVVENAQKVIVKTHDQPQQIENFNTAVVALANARMQLAVAGNQTQVRLLSEDAQTLYKKDPKSFAAVESAFKVLQYTQLKAQALAAKDPKWALAFARQARLFTDKFPQETNRAAIHLVAAGNICDKIGLLEEAKSCMLIVEDRFPNSPFAEQVQNPLRRLRLPGQELLEFGGSTIDGNFLSVDQFRGRSTVIAFWASNSIVFQEDMKLINEIVESFVGNTTIVGVNLDKEEAAVDRFIQLTNNKWQHIFFSAPSKRGMENPIAKHYGVSIVPSYWLVDKNGIVQTVNLKPEELRQWLGKLSLAGN